MLRASTVPSRRDEEVADTVGQRETAAECLAPSASLALSLLRRRVPKNLSLPFPPVLSLSLARSLARRCPISTSPSRRPAEIKRGTKKKSDNEGGGRGERHSGRRRGRLGKRVPACTTRYTHLQQF